MNLVIPEMSSNQGSLIYCVVLHKVFLIWIISCTTVFATDAQYSDYS